LMRQVVPMGYTSWRQAQADDDWWTSARKTMLSRSLPPTSEALRRSM
jgi:hypothetical protein